MMLDRLGPNCFYKINFVRKSAENDPSDNAALFSEEFFVSILHFVAASLSNISSCDAVKIRIENI